MSAPAEPPVQHAAGDAVDAATLYALLTLRVDVFVAEQQAAYRELDGVDLLASTLHLWIAGTGEGHVGTGPAPALGPPLGADGRRLLAAARVVAAPAGAELGRVVVAGAHRGRGLGETVVRHGLAHAGRPVHLNAQAHLEAWYARFGFATVGPTFEWDGIAHVPMRLER